MFLKKEAPPHRNTVYQARISNCAVPDGSFEQLRKYDSDSTWISSEVAAQIIDQLLHGRLGD